MVLHILRGVYTFETLTVNGCDSLVILDLTIFYSDQIMLTIDDSLTNNISCYGFNDGQIGLNVVGGFAPISLKFLTDNRNKFDSNLSAGNYFIEVLDELDVLILFQFFKST